MNAARREKRETLLCLCDDDLPFFDCQRRINFVLKTLYGATFVFIAYPALKHPSIKDETKKGRQRKGALALVFLDAFRCLQVLNIL